MGSSKHTKSTTNEELENEKKKKMQRIKEMREELVKSSHRGHKKYTEEELQERLKLRKSTRLPYSVWVASPKIEPQTESSNKNGTNSKNKEKEEELSDDENAPVELFENERRLHEKERKKHWKRIEKTTKKRNFDHTKADKNNEIENGQHHNSSSDDDNDLSDNENGHNNGHNSGSDSGNTSGSDENNSGSGSDNSESEDDNQSHGHSRSNSNSHSHNHSHSRSRSRNRSRSRSHSHSSSEKQKKLRNQKIQHSLPIQPKIDTDQNSTNVNNNGVSEMEQLSLNTTSIESMDSQLKQENTPITSNGNNHNPDPINYERKVILCFGDNNGNISNGNNDIQHDENQNLKTNYSETNNIHNHNDVENNDGIENTDETIWIERDEVEKIYGLRYNTLDSNNNDNEETIGPRLPEELNTRLDRRDYGGAMLPGEADAIANFVQRGMRIPRRGEVGLTSEEIANFESLGYVMSGSRHKKMNAIRIRKENQIYSAEEKRALSMVNFEEKLNREKKLMAAYQKMLNNKRKMSDH